METFKTLEEITQPDPRNANLRLVNAHTGESRPFTIADVHAGLQGAELVELVPEAVRDHFQTARHLALYSWFVYRFIPVAQMQAYATLEYALRLRLGHQDDDRPPGLKLLLRKALKEKLLTDARFRDWPGHQDGAMGATPGSTAWIERALLDFVTFFRNNLAHGSSTLLPDGGRTLRMVADAINQLFTRPEQA